MREFKEDRQKLKELIVFISDECKVHETYGATLLNKLLFFADFLAYAKFGKPITGAEYVREKRGPVPSAVRTKEKNPVRELMREGAIRIQETVLPRNMTRRTPVALRHADLSLFSSEEIALVKSVIDSFGPWRAGTLSKYTHEFALWQSVALDEPLPYETIFVSPDQRLGAHAISRGQELAREHGWLTGKS